MRPALRRVIEEQGVKILELGCPFCMPPMHIEPGQPCPTCGAEIVIMAVKPEGGKFVPLKCMICGKSNGHLVQVEGGFKHEPSCLLMPMEIETP